MDRITPARDTRRLHRAVLVPGLLLALGIVPVVAGVVRLTGLLTGQASAESARFFDSPWPITLHILSVIPYALLGALQFAPALRRSRWHRVVGLPLVPLGLVVAVTGLWMAQFYPWPDGDGQVLYGMRLIVGVAMTAAVVQGTVSLWRRHYREHGAWMLRAYAIGMGAGTQVLTHLPWFILVDRTPGEASRAVMMGVAWIANVLVAEYVIRRQSVAGPGDGHRRMRAVRAIAS